MTRPPPSLTALADLLLHLLKWLLIAAAVAILAGTASAAFLFALDWATRTRLAHAWLIWLLPVAGFAVGWLYLRYGSAVEGGANLLIDEIHDPKNHPLRMAPLVLGATVVSHLFGASVGREGTAVQMGGALADQLTRLFRLDQDDRRIILMAGISAGFASVFGTPLAGALFGLEVLAIGRLRYEAMLPCLLAAVIADQVGLLWACSIRTTPCPDSRHLGLDPGRDGRRRRALRRDGQGVCASHARRERLDETQDRLRPLRPLAGGVVVALAVWLLGTDRYIGLGIPTIVDALQGPLPAYDFLGKMAFTIVSLGTGFKGGE
jgi:H+/Cl- antiporter ClcA